MLKQGPESQKKSCHKNKNKWESPCYTCYKKAGN